MLRHTPSVPPLPLSLLDVPGRRLRPLYLAAAGAWPPFRSGVHRPGRVTVTHPRKDVTLSTRRSIYRSREAWTSRDF